MINKNKKTVTVVSDVKAKIAERQEARYLANPEYVHPNGDDVVICAPAEIENDLLDRGYKPSTFEAYVSQGKPKDEPKEDPKPDPKPEPSKPATPPAK